ncbi:MAG: PhoH family protein [Dissulfurispiraceae bacterium]
MKKTFVLDTNVLIHDPTSLFKFGDHDIVVPFTVIEELDRHKKGRGEIATSARQVLRTIDELREGGSLSSGVRIPSGGTIAVSLPSENGHRKSCTNGEDDNQIIKTALSIAEKLPISPMGDPASVVLVSKDTAVRIKAESLGINVEDYMGDKTSLFQKYGRVLTNGDNTNGVTSVRYLESNDSIYKMTGSDNLRPVKRAKERMGISPKNAEQECALDALTDHEIEIVALTGNAGTGKTLLALAAGLHQTSQIVKKTSFYEQVIVSRPIMPMGRDIGYLPGDIEEKLTPWMQPIFDNLEVILNTPKGLIKDNANISKIKSYQYLMDAGLLQVEPLTYIRGRSLPKRYFVIDEAQNLRPLDVKTIVTRCGEGTKIIFTGDLDQIDTPYLDKMSNGLSYLISRFINEENFCFLNFSRSVRSRLAEQGARLL